MPIIGCTSKDNCKRDAFLRTRQNNESGIGIIDTRHGNAPFARSTTLHSLFVVSRHAAL